MKVWAVEYGAHYETHMLGVYSSKEKAEEAGNHFRSNNGDVSSIWIGESELDEYWNENCTKLAKALK